MQDSNLILLFETYKKLIKLDLFTNVEGEQLPKVQEDGGEAEAGGPSHPRQLPSHSSAHQQLQGRVGGLQRSRSDGFEPWLQQNKLLRHQRGGHRLPQGPPRQRAGALLRRDLPAARPRGEAAPAHLARGGGEEPVCVCGARESVCAVWRERRHLRGRKGVKL